MSLDWGAGKWFEEVKILLLNISFLHILWQKEFPKTGKATDNWRGFSPFIELITQSQCLSILKGQLQEPI